MFEPTKYNIGNIDLSTVPVGTHFEVINGAWKGVVIEHNGKRFIKHPKGEFELTKDYAVSNEIKILN